MREKIFAVVVYAASVPLALAITYGFALLGEPRNYWFWHDILGVIK